MGNKILEQLNSKDLVYLKGLRRVAIDCREEMTQFVNSIEYVIAQKEIAENDKSKISIYDVLEENNE